MNEATYFSADSHVNEPRDLWRESLPASLRERALRGIKPGGESGNWDLVLGDQELSVQDIVDCVGTSQSNISQHLAILREKGVLRTRKEANRVYYRVGDERTLNLIGMMREVFCGES